MSANEKIRHTPGPWIARRVYGSTWQVTAGHHDLMSTTNNEENALLIALAPTAPHDCDVPGCPGVENKRKLVAFSRLNVPVPSGEWESDKRVYTEWVNEAFRCLEDYPALHTALEKIDAIRNDIIGRQSINWSAHIYPLVAALEGAGFRGLGYDKARAAIETLEQENERLKADLIADHRWGLEHATKLEATNAALVEALRKYGRHLYGRHDGCLARGCYCGLDATLAKAEGAK